MAAVLCEADLTVELHDSHFQWDTPDTEWLPIVGERRWVVLTKDQNIRRNMLERAAVENAEVRMFVFTAGSVREEEHAATFLSALPRILRLLENHPVPTFFIATITRSGIV